jgi:uncharacterized protein
MEAFLMDIKISELADYCKENNIRWLALFGSALRGDMRSESDVDLLVEFTAPVGLFTLCRVEDELSARFFGGRKVDLVTQRSLSRYFRDEVLAKCETLYGKAG